jgi:hypothetical protein
MKMISKMNKPGWAWASVFALFITGTAFAQQPAGQPPPAGATVSGGSSQLAANSVVMKVGTKTVTKQDIDYLLGTLSPQAQKQVESQGKRSIGDQYAMMMILYQAAVGQRLDQSDQYRMEMSQHRRQVLAQLEYQSLLSKMQVTQPEVSAYYSAHADEFREAQVRQIAIRLKSPSGGAADQGLTLEQAQEKANEIRGALASGMDPAKVAQQYGVPNQVVVSTTPQTIADTPQLPAFAKAVFNLGIGQFTQPAQANGALVVLQVTGQSKMSLKDATPAIEQALRQQKMQAQIAALKSRTNIWMDPAYFGSAPVSSSTTQPGAATSAPTGPKS